MAAEFDVVGTRDPSAFLAAPFAIDLLRAFGGDDGVEAVYRYNHDLARWAGAFLAERWGTGFSTPDELLGAMVAVPLPARLGTDPVRVQTALDGDGSRCCPRRRRWSVVRVSAQVYCGREDVEQLADAVDRQLA